MTKGGKGEMTMKAIDCLAGALIALTASIAPGLAQAPKSGIERMYVLYCGDIALTDMGRFSPGYSGPGALSSTCYLFKHAQGWLLWDTGLGDAIASATSICFRRRRWSFKRRNTTGPIRPVRRAFPRT